MSSDARNSGPTGSSSSYPHQPVQAPIIRPPVGFAWDGPAPFSNTTPPEHHGASTSNRESSKKKRSKDKPRDKEKTKDKSKHRPSEKPYQEPDGETARHYHASMPSFSPSFRVRNYSNEPSPPGASHAPLHGHYPANYVPNVQPTGMSDLTMTCTRWLTAVIDY